MSAASELAHAVHNGDRRALAKAITLVESTRAEDRDAARTLLSLLLPVAKPGIRLGVTGVPGAGKSTLIDALGMRAIADGRRVAVLAVDPS
ncbi:MAG TPA: methylmalonyl Co-A mutase-associated GTPase MeaB, partial [Polyangiaceae bacterium]|nr:methylmalonyl Co-A mutase-associated GTPase MeaB [Polyangiaceae bacterium]